jgi:RimJ/RimL family protein N-acetyltransferase
LLFRIEAEGDTRNAPSAKLLRHLGFQREGLMRQRWTMKGQVKDTLFFAMLRDDWVG